MTLIPIYKPYVSSESLRYAHEALDSTWLSSQGPYLQQATDKLQEVLGAKYVLLTNNGTTAMHLVAKVLSRHFPPQDDEGNEGIDLLVPDNVYVAAWNAFMFDQKFILCPVRADLETWNFDLQDLDTKIKYWTRRHHKAPAVLVVPNLGNVIHVPELKQKYPEVLFVEDNCEGFLGTYNKQQTGTAGIAAGISFFGNKNITSGEGGAVIVQTQEDYEYIKLLHGQGQSSQKFIHSDLGYNYRMTNVQAAILLGQLEILPEILKAKKCVFDFYRYKLGFHDKIKLPTQAPNTTNARWMFGLRLIGNPSYLGAEEFFRNRGVEIRPMFYPMSAHAHTKCWVEAAQDYDESAAQTLNRECIILPSYPELTLKEQHYICSVVEKYSETIPLA